MNINCSTCLHEDKHPFGLTYIENICSGCHTHKEKYYLDWSQLESRLNSLIKKTVKSNSHKRTYDCIVPVQGFAEDYYVVEKVLDLELRPLLVSINDYFSMISDGIICTILLQYLTWIHKYIVQIFINIKNWSRQHC